MPWINSHVLIGLTAFKVAVSWFLICRNRVFDRINMVMYLPLVVQDCLQAGLWYVIDPTVETATSCSLANSRMSLFAMMILVGIPMWWAWVEYLLSGLLLLDKQALANHGLQYIAAAVNVECPEFSMVWPRRKLLVQMRNKIQLCLGQSQLFLLTGFLYLAVRWNYPRIEDWKSSSLDWVFPGPVCTTLSESGYQVWPLAVFPHWSVSFVFLAVFGMMSTVYNYVPFPSLMSTVTDGFGVLGILIYMTVGPGYASMWSSVQSCGIFFALFEPMLLRSNRILDPEALAPEGEDVRAGQGRLFSMAWHRFGMIRILPWVEYKESAGHGHGHSHSHGHECEMDHTCCASHSDESATLEDGTMRAPTSMAM